jgi:hypothetical protein
VKLSHLKRLEALEHRRATALKPRQLTFTERLAYKREHPEEFEAARVEQAEQDAHKQREQDEFNSADTPSKIAILRARLAAVHEKWKDREPWRAPGREPYWSRLANDPQHYRVSVHRLELDIAEAEGLLTDAQLWVARSRLANSTGKEGAFVVPTHEESMAEIQAGKVLECYRPESMKKPDSPREPELVPSHVGPQAPRLPSPRREQAPSDDREPPLLERKPSSPREQYEQQQNAPRRTRSSDGDFVEDWGCTEPPVT